MEKTMVEDQKMKLNFDKLHAVCMARRKSNRRLFPIFLDGYLTSDKFLA